MARDKTEQIVKALPVALVAPVSAIASVAPKVSLKKQKVISDG